MMNSVCFLHWNDEFPCFVVFWSVFVAQRVLQENMGLTHHITLFCLYYSDGIDKADINIDR